MRAPPGRTARLGCRRLRAAASRRGTRDAAVAWCCRGKGSSCGRARVYATSVRVLLADPPAFTPWYDHELAAALARNGADAELRTSRFRFGAIPDPDGYVRNERFYPLSSRLFGRSRLRLPLKAAEHLAVMRSLGAARPDVLHVQWVALPQLDVRVRYRTSSVFTAHDLLPRRTASKRDLWQRLL